MYWQWSKFEETTSFHNDLTLPRSTICGFFTGTSHYGGVLERKIRPSHRLFREISYRQRMMDAIYSTFRVEAE